MVFSRATRTNESGQGALEYLLLIGGAVLVTTIVLVMVITGTFTEAGTLTDDNLNTFESTVTLHAAFGDGTGGPAGPLCGNGTLDAGEECDSGNLFGQTCTTIPGGYTGGTLSCNNSTCQFDESLCTSAPPAGFTSFGVSTPSLDLANPGYSKYTFTWTGTTFASGMGPAGGIGVVTGVPFPVPTAVLDNSGGMVSSTLYAPSSPYHFSPTSGSGQQGFLSNTFIKNVYFPLAGGNPPAFGIVGNNGASQYALASTTAAGTFLTDVEAPAAPIPTIQTATANGGKIDFSWAEPLDNYLGATYPSTIDHTIVYDLAPITPSNILTHTQAGQFVTGFAAGGSVVNATINYQSGTPGLIPSRLYHSALIYCDRWDPAHPTLAPNCNLWTSSTATAASKEAKSVEAETGTLTSLITDTTTYPGLTVVKYSGTGCTAAGSKTIVPVTLLQPSSATATYRVFVRYGNTSGVPNQRLNVAFGPNNGNAVLGATTGTNLTWSSAISLANVPASTNLTITHGAGGTPTCYNNVFIDRIIVTTDATCVPTAGTDGSNCGSFSP